MLKPKITSLLKKGENYNIEFKECKREINKDAYVKTRLIAYQQLGSGFKKIAKYAKAYFGSEPVIQEKDIFRFESQFGTEMLEILNNSSTISIPINRDNEPVNATDQGTDQGTDQDERLRMVLIFCKKPRSREDIQKYLKMKHRDNFKKQILQPLLKSKLLKLTIPDKPSSPNQKYITVDKEQNQ